MYYLINIDSPLSLAQQIAVCDTFHNLSTARKVADRRKADTGQNWELLEITTAYTTQTFDEAHRAALDVPHMARD
jgi:hypothetical protein